MVTKQLSVWCGIYSRVISFHDKEDLSEVIGNMFSDVISVKVWLSIQIKEKYWEG